MLLRIYLLRRWLLVYLVLITAGLLIAQRPAVDPSTCIAYGTAATAVFAAIVARFPVIRQLVLLVSATFFSGIFTFMILVATGFVPHDIVGIVIGLVLGGAFAHISLFHNWGAWIGWTPSISLVSRLTSTLPASDIWALLIAKKGSEADQWPFTTVSIRDVSPDTKVMIGALGNGAFQSIQLTDIVNAFPTKHESESVHSFGTLDGGNFIIKKPDYIKFRYTLTLTQDKAGITQVNSNLQSDNTPTNFAIFYWLDDMGADMACSMRSFFEQTEDWSLFHATCASARKEAADLRAQNL